MPTMQQEQAQQQAHMHQLHTLQVTKACAGEEESQPKVANRQTSPPSRAMKIHNGAAEEQRKTSALL